MKNVLLTETKLAKNIIPGGGLIDDKTGGGSSDTGGDGGNTGGDGGKF